MNFIDKEIELIEGVFDDLKKEIIRLSISEKAISAKSENEIYEIANDLKKTFRHN